MRTESQPTAPRHRQSPSPDQARRHHFQLHATTTCSFFGGRRRSIDPAGGRRESRSCRHVQLLLRSRLGAEGLKAVRARPFLLLVHLSPFALAPLPPRRRCQRPPPPPPGAPSAEPLPHPALPTRRLSSPPFSPPPAPLCAAAALAPAAASSGPMLPPESCHSMLRRNQRGTDSRTHLVAAGGERVPVQQACHCKVGSWTGFPAIGGTWVLLRRLQRWEDDWS